MMGFDLFDLLTVGLVGYLILVGAWLLYAPDPKSRDELGWWW